MATPRPTTPPKKLTSDELKNELLEGASNLRIAHANAASQDEAKDVHEITQQVARDSIKENYSQIRERIHSFETKKTEERKKQQYEMDMLAQVVAENAINFPKDATEEQIFDSLKEAMRFRATDKALGDPTAFLLPAAPESKLLLPALDFLRNYEAVLAKEIKIAPPDNLFTEDDFPQFHIKPTAGKFLVDNPATAHAIVFSRALHAAAQVPSVKKELRDAALSKIPEEIKERPFRSSIAQVISQQLHLFPKDSKADDITAALNQVLANWDSHAPEKTPKPADAKPLYDQAFAFLLQANNLINPVPPLSDPLYREPRHAPAWGNAIHAALNVYGGQHPSYQRHFYDKLKDAKAPVAEFKKSLAELKNPLITASGGPSRLAEELKKLGLGAPDLKEYQTQITMLEEEADELQQGLLRSPDDAEAKEALGASLYRLSEKKAAAQNKLKQTVQQLAYVKTAQDKLTNKIILKHERKFLEDSKEESFTPSFNVQIAASHAVAIAQAQGASPEVTGMIAASIQHLFDFMTKDEDDFFKQFRDAGDKLGNFDSKLLIKIGENAANEAIRIFNDEKYKSLPHSQKLEKAFLASINAARYTTGELTTEDDHDVLVYDPEKILDQKELSKDNDAFVERALDSKAIAKLKRTQEDEAIKQLFAAPLSVPADLNKILTEDVDDKFYDADKNLADQMKKMAANELASQERARMIKRYNAPWFARAGETDRKAVIGSDPDSKLTKGTFYVNSGKQEVTVGEDGSVTSEITSVESAQAFIFAVLKANDAGRTLNISECHHPETLLFLIQAAAGNPPGTGCKRKIELGPTAEATLRSLWKPLDEPIFGFILNPIGTYLRQRMFKKIDTMIKQHNAKIEAEFQKHDEQKITEVKDAKAVGKLPALKKAQEEVNEAANAAIGDYKEAKTTSDAFQELDKSKATFTKIRVRKEEAERKITSLEKQIKTYRDNEEKDPSRPMPYSDVLERQLAMNKKLVSELGKIDEVKLEDLNGQLEAAQKAHDEAITLRSTAAKCSTLAEVKPLIDQAKAQADISAQAKKTAKDISAKVKLRLEDLESSITDLNEALKNVEDGIAKINEELEIADKEAKGAFSSIEAVVKKINEMEGKPSPESKRGAAPVVNVLDQSLSDLREAKDTTGINGEINDAESKLPAPMLDLSKEKEALDSAINAAEDLLRNTILIQAKQLEDKKAIIQAQDKARVVFEGARTIFDLKTKNLTEAKKRRNDLTALNGTALGEPPPSLDEAKTAQDLLKFAEDARDRVQTSQRTLDETREKLTQAKENIETAKKAITDKIKAAKQSARAQIEKDFKETQAQVGLAKKEVPKIVTTFETKLDSYEILKDKLKTIEEINNAIGRSNASVEDFIKKLKVRLEELVTAKDSATRILAKLENLQNVFDGPSFGIPSLMYKATESLTKVDLDQSTATLAEAKTEVSNLNTISGTFDNFIKAITLPGGLLAKQAEALHEEAINAEKTINNQFRETKGEIARCMSAAEREYKTVQDFTNELTPEIKKHSTAITDVKIQIQKINAEISKLGGVPTTDPDDIKSSEVIPESKYVEAKPEVDKAIADLSIKDFKKLTDKNAHASEVLKKVQGLLQTVRADKSAVFQTLEAAQANHELANNFLRIAKDQLAKQKAEIERDAKLKADKEAAERKVQEQKLNAEREAKAAAEAKVKAQAEKEAAERKAKEERIAKEKAEKQVAEQRAREAKLAEAAKDAKGKDIGNLLNQQGVRAIHVLPPIPPQGPKKGSTAAAAAHLREAKRPTSQPAAQQASIASPSPSASASSSSSSAPQPGDSKSDKLSLGDSKPNTQTPEKEVKSKVKCDLNAPLNQKETKSKPEGVSETNWINYINALKHLGEFNEKMLPLIRRNALKEKNIKAVLAAVSEERKRRQNVHDLEVNKKEQKLPLSTGGKVQQTLPEDEEAHKEATRIGNAALEARSHLMPPKIEETQGDRILREKNEELWAKATGNAPRGQTVRDPAKSKLIKSPSQSGGSQAVRSNSSLKNGGRPS